MADDDAATPPDSLREGVLRELVFGATDATDKDAANALAELVGLPDVTWREVYDVLAAGRTYPAVPDLRAPVLDPAKQAAHFEGFPWEPGVARAYDIGADYDNWYYFDVPPDYDGKSPLGVWLDLGGVVPERSDDEPPGFVRAQLAPAFQSATELGGASVTMTAGWFGQSVVLSVVRDMERRFNVDRNRVFVSGYSRLGNATLYNALHWPDLFAGACPASGFFEFPDAMIGNLATVALLVAHGSDGGHKGANEFSKKLVSRLRRARHPNASGLAVDGRAIGQAMTPQLWEFAAKHSREPHPRHVRYVLNDARHRGAYWVEILGAQDPGKVRAMPIRAPTGQDVDEVRLHSRVAVAEAHVTGENEVTLRLRNVRAARLWLSPELFDLDEPITLRRGRKETSVVPEPTIATLIASFRRDRDRTRLYPAFVDVE